MSFITLFLILCDFWFVLYCISGEHTFLFEKLNRYGLGNKVIIWNDRKGYPAPLPQNKPNAKTQIHTPYQTLYQGVKRKTDVPVFQKSFKYRPNVMAHHIYCKGEVRCTITHLAVETIGGIPVILRGGVGYDFFDIVARAKQGEQLAGTIRAYCRNNTQEY